MKKLAFINGLTINGLVPNYEYFTWLYVVRYSFIPTYTFSRIEFFFFFHFLLSKFYALFFS